MGYGLYYVCIIQKSKKKLADFREFWSKFRFASLLVFDTDSI